MGSEVWAQWPSHLVPGVAEADAGMQNVTDRKGCDISKTRASGRWIACQTFLNVEVLERMSKGWGVQGLIHLAPSLYLMHATERAKRDRGCSELSLVTPCLCL